MNTAVELLSQSYHLWAYVSTNAEGELQLRFLNHFQKQSISIT